MKLKYLLAAFLLVAGFVACTPEENQKEPEKKGLEVEFNIAEEAFSIQVGESKEFKMTLVSGENVKFAWYVDNEKVSSTASVTWRFETVGTTVVKGEATDGEHTIDQSYTVTVTGTPLDVTYSVEEEEVDAVVDTPFTVSVTINGGDKQTVHAWTLDGEAAGEGLEFSKTFTIEELGPHTLVYNGSNADGMTASKSWTVNVKDLPLEVNFTPAKDTLYLVVGQSVDLAAQAVHGTTGVAYAWKVNGQDVVDATAATYKYEASVADCITVECTVTNAAEEKVENKWVLVVEEASPMLLDAENMTELPAATTLWFNDNAGSIVDNPVPGSTVNPGKKVFKDAMPNATWATSGLIKVYPDEIVESSYRAQFTTVRIKVYLGNNDYVPFMVLPISGDKASRPTKVNGTAFYPNHTKDLWDSLIKHDDWNVLEYNIITGNYQNIAETLASVTQIQFRFFVDYNNSTTKITETSDHIVYFDDIEMVE